MISSNNLPFFSLLLLFPFLRLCSASLRPFHSFHSRRAGTLLIPSRLAHFALLSLHVRSLSPYVLLARQLCASLLSASLVSHIVLACAPCPLIAVAVVSLCCVSSSPLVVSACSLLVLVSRVPRYSSLASASCDRVS